MDLHSLIMASETLLYSVAFIQRQVKILRNWPQFIHFYHLFRWKGSLVILRKQGKGILWRRCHNVLGYGLKWNLILMLMLFRLSFTASLIKRIGSVHTIRSQVPLSHNFTFLGQINFHSTVWNLYDIAASSLHSWLEVAFPSQLLYQTRIILSLTKVPPWSNYLLC